MTILLVITAVILVAMLIGWLERIRSRSWFRCPECEIYHRSNGQMTYEYQDWEDLRECGDCTEKVRVERKQL